MSATAERKSAPSQWPRRRPDSVRVRALYGAVSRGTERLVFSGRVPESEHERMRGPNMGGAFPFPVKYGYAVVGRVEDGPAELLGRTVFALHPHQTFFTMPADAVTASSVRGAAGTRRAGGQHGNGAQRRLGRRARPCRSHRDRRRRCCGRAVRLPVRAHSGHGGDSCRRRARTRRNRADARGAVFAAPGRAASIATSSFTPAPARRASPPRCGSPARKRQCWN